MTGDEFQNLRQGDILRHNAAEAADTMVVIGVAGTTVFVGKITYTAGANGAAVVQPVGKTKAAEWRLAEKRRPATQVRVA